MRNKVISISSDSSIEDDIPLKIFKNHGSTEDSNCYDILCKRSTEVCEFCDRISNSRYSSIVHNVSHIIIPLLNQRIYQCPACLHSFTCVKDLRTHSIKKHPEVTDFPSKRRISLTSSQKESHTRLKEKPNVISKNNDTNNTESIKNRLVFEDDATDQLLNDLTTDCKVNLELFNAPWMNGFPDEFSGKSVHYNELVKPGVYRCKKCGKGFPTRYDVIVHESSHIKFKNSLVSLCVICKKYLIGGRNDLRHHYMTFHRGNIDKTLQTESEYITSLFFDGEQRRTSDSKFLCLCDMCFSFCKNTPSMNYEYERSVSEIGKRYKCEKCAQLFFEINLVKRSSLRKVYTTLTSAGQISKRRKKTNEDRLKTIAHRFKMMKH